MLNSMCFNRILYPYFEGHSTTHSIQFSKITDFQEMCFYNFSSHMKLTSVPTYENSLQKNFKVHICLHKYYTMQGVLFLKQVLLCSDRLKNLKHGGGLLRCNVVIDFFVRMAQLFF